MPIIEFGAQIEAVQNIFVTGKYGIFSQCRIKHCTRVTTGCPSIVVAGSAQFLEHPVFIVLSYTICSSNKLSGDLYNFSSVMEQENSNRRFSCTECSYSAKFASELVVHTRIHTGERPFKCDMCDYTAAQNVHLTLHLKSHYIFF